MQGWKMPYFVLPVSAWIDSRFTGGGALGDDDHHNGFLEVPVYFAEWAKSKVYNQDQTLDELE
jgi:hypothetical protein